MPRKVSSSDGVRLAPISFRTTTRKRAELEEKANEAGRSLSQEVERLLDFAMQFEEDIGDPELVNAMKFIAQAAGWALRDSDVATITNPRTRDRVSRAIFAAANLYLPVVALEKSHPGLGQALQEIDFALRQSIRGFSPRSIYALADGYPLKETELEELHERLESLKAQHFSNATPAETSARVDKWQKSLREAQSAAMETHSSLLDASFEDLKSLRHATVAKIDRFREHMAEPRVRESATRKAKSANQRKQRNPNATRKT